MPAQFALAAEQAKKFRNSLALVFEALDYIAALENPADLENNLKRLKDQATTLIASYRKTAEDEAARNMASAIRATQLKCREMLKKTEDECATLKRQAQAEANKIVADARKAADQLDIKVKAAHAAAQEAMR
jgi:hypothetical protein